MVWAAYCQNKEKIQVAEMTYLRAIKGISLRDGKRKQIVRAELRAEPILKSTEKQFLKWFGT